MIALLLILVSSILSAQVNRFGLPACSGPDRTLAIKSAFILCHDALTKTPVWTAHEITPSTLAPSPLRPLRRSHFRHDHSLGHPAASDADYRNSGWTRGHMVPAADVAGNEQALRESFLLSNAAPQDAVLNVSLWRRLENEIRRRAQTADSVIVFTGPIFCGNPERIGPGKVAVPCGFFKAAVEIRGTQTTTLAVIVPNAPSSTRNWTDFAVPLDRVRERTGLDILAVGRYTFSPAQIHAGRRPPRSGLPHSDSLISTYRAASSGQLPRVTSE